MFTVSPPFRYEECHTILPYDIFRCPSQNRACGFSAHGSSETHPLRNVSRSVMSPNFVYTHESISMYGEYFFETHGVSATPFPPSRFRDLDGTMKWSDCHDAVFRPLLFGGLWAEYSNIETIMALPSSYLFFVVSCNGLRPRLVLSSSTMRRKECCLPCSLSTSALWEIV